MNSERNAAGKAVNCPYLSDPIDTAWRAVKKGNYSAIWSCSDRACRVKITSRRRPVGQRRGLQLIDPERCLELYKL